MYRYKGFDGFYPRILLYGERRKLPKKQEFERYERYSWMCIESLIVL